MNNGSEYLLDKLASCFSHAQYQGFPQIEYQDKDWEMFHKWKQTLSEEERRLHYKGSLQEPDNCFVTKTRYHSKRDFSVIGVFEQTWGSTALGFDGMAGQAITTEYTIVLESHMFPIFLVYFGHHFAYKLTKPNRLFFNDLARNTMLYVKNSFKYMEDLNEK